MAVAWSAHAGAPAWRASMEGAATGAARAPSVEAAATRAAERMMGAMV